MKSARFLRGSCGKPCILTLVFHCSISYNYSIIKKLIEILAFFSEPSLICEDESRLANRNGMLSAANRRLVKT
jgi:hypothetical protein